MKIKAIFLPAFLLFLFIVPPAFAITISLDPSDQEILLGDIAVVNINISGLGDFAPDSLGAFDLTIIYDPTILSLNSFEFGLLLGDPSAGETITFFDDSMPGELELGEVSLLLDFELDDLQPSYFTLATLEFSGIGPGISDFGFDLELEPPVLSDAFGFAFDPVSFEGASISVAEPVPEPTTILLVSTGLLGLAGFRRRSRK